VGYSPKKVDVELHQNEFISVKIDELNAEIEEVKVVGERDDSKTHQFEAGKVKLTMKDIAALPAYLGEVDVLKGFQHLPGVQSVNDGISLLSVRGGSFDQNLIILDEAPVYNPHTCLAFSRFLILMRYHKPRCTKVLFPPDMEAVFHRLSTYK
jgi:hypothetical protein